MLINTGEVYVQKEQEQPLGTYIKLIVYDHCSKSIYHRWATLGSCLYSSKDTFIARDERQRSAASDFRLADPSLWHIRPNTSQVSTL